MKAVSLLLPSCIGEKARHLANARSQSRQLIALTRVLKSLKDEQT